MITLGFIFIHLFSNVISSRKLNVQYMSSFAAGVGISYAIVHLLPHLAYFQTVLIDEFGWDSGIFYSHGVYGIVLFGLVFSYVIYKIDERTFMVLEKKDITSAKNAFFWSDIAFHVIYNIMIGYIVIANTLSERFYILTYFIAFGLRFLMNDWCSIIIMVPFTTNMVVLCFPSVFSRGCVLPLCFIALLSGGHH